MSAALALPALLMGLAGGPHCAAMCGAPCAGLTGGRPRALLGFHAGRLAGYALAGALAAIAVHALAWLGAQAAMLRPAWMALHLAVLAWGLVLLVQARQPVWVQAAGGGIWARVRAVARKTSGAFGVGMLWAFMPCGLLYSALLLAALAGGPLEGALTMALFALGSAVPLALAPRLLARVREAWSARAAGGLLVLASVWALWGGMAGRIADWCGIPLN